MKEKAVEYIEKYLWIILTVSIVFSAIFLSSNETEIENVDKLESQIAESTGMDNCNVSSIVGHIAICKVDLGDNITHLKRFSVDISGNQTIIKEE